MSEKDFMAVANVQFSYMDIFNMMVEYRDGNLVKAKDSLEMVACKNRALLTIAGLDRDFLKEAIKRLNEDAYDVRKMKDKIDRVSKGILEDAISYKKKCEQLEKKLLEREYRIDQLDQKLLRRDRSLSAQEKKKKTESKGVKLA